MFKYLITKTSEYIFIILTATIFSSILFSKCFSEENVFIIDEIEVEGIIDVNFSRNKYINRAFLDSYEILMSKILLSSDFNKVSTIKLDKIKNLISSFKILDETYRNDEYKATLKIFYDEIKVKKFLSRKNISFSQSKNITAVFYPVLFVDEELQALDDNYFYHQWNEIKIKNESISFVMPVEDLDDINKIKEIKNNIEDLDVVDIIKKYNIRNYVFAFMQNENKKLNIYLKTNFNDNQVSKNISYELDNINNKIKLKKILTGLKKEVTDIWKKENIINLSAPLSLRIKFKNTNLRNLNTLKNTLYKISIIDNYSLEEFSVNYAFFKIYYYGDPRKLTKELSKFGYLLKNEQGRWVIYSE